MQNAKKNFDFPAPGQLLLFPSRGKVAELLLPGLCATPINFKLIKVGQKSGWIKA